MLSFYQFPGGYGLSSVSQFCTKLEAFLRMNNIEFETKPANPRKAPRGKTPYVRLEDGRYMGDSQLIQQHLTETYNLQIDAHLSPEQHAIGHAVRRLCEEHTYWAVVYSRWIDPRGWQQQRPLVAGIMPAFVRPFLPDFLRKDLRKTLKAHGIGRHDQDTIYAFAAHDVEAMAGILGDKTYLLGDKISSYDATFFAALWHIRQNPVDTAFCTAMKTHTNLTDYVARMLKELKFEAS